MLLRVHRILYKTKVEGPGTRCCIWVQGCSIHCKGCGNKETWSFEGGQLIDTDKIYNMINSRKEIEGVTFLGGEPFEQATALYDLGLKVKNLGLSVVAFTGYTYDHILKCNLKPWNDLLSITDLLIDGPFEEDKFDLSRPWVGSSNQSYRFLTTRYKYLESNLSSIKNKVEIRLNSNGTIFINGMGDFRYIKKQFEDLEEIDK